MAEPVFPIDGVIRRYDWGSRTAIQHLLGLEPDGRPAAELWFGAHSGDPSPALDTTLADLIAADPEAMLGAESVRAHGPRLPFLLKVLAADRTLSIQVHPNRAQAQAGFAAEESAGIPRDAPERNYVDDNHKPELLCALTPFEALCGFRPVAETLAVLADIDVAELGFLADLLRGPDGLRAAFTALLAVEDPAPLVAAVTTRATSHGPLRPAHLAAEHFPDDIGVVLTLLLNPVRLDPGQAIYLGAGNVHCYLRGMGVEIMANSDNVLRCGLTPKHVDVAEVLKTTDIRELTHPVREAEPVGLAWSQYPVPVPDFALGVLDLDANSGAIDTNPLGAQILLCVTGQASVNCLGRSVDLAPGQAAFVAARPEGFVIAGTGTVYTAAAGDTR